MAVKEDELGREIMRELVAASPETAIALLFKAASDLRLVVDALLDVAECLNQELSARGCCTEDAAPKGAAEDYGGLDALAKANAAIKSIRKERNKDE